MWRDGTSSTARSENEINPVELRGSRKNRSQATFLHVPTTVPHALWRRLDAPGHDACSLDRLDDGWRLEGMAVFRHDLGPARVAYRVDCDDAWLTREGVLQARLGETTLNLHIRRQNGAWRINGAPVSGLDGCVDLDLGFTPSTNLLQLRRVALAVGEQAHFSVAWLDVPQATLVALPQRYERRSADCYWYESPTAGYAATLEMHESGFVRVYPGLWMMDPAS